MLLSVNEDWKNFTLNHRRGIADEIDAKKRAIKEKESTLDSQELAKYREYSGYNTKQPLFRELPDYVKDDTHVHIVTLELHQLPPHVDEVYVRNKFFQGQHVVRFDT